MKTSGPALAPGDLGRIDAVLLTHDHHDDNLDPSGRAFLPSAEVVVTTVSGSRRLGNGARGLEPWATTRLEAPGRRPLEVTATPCRHGPPLSRPVAGDVIGFALGWEGQSRTASSGSPATRSSTTACERWPTASEVDVALLHLGGVRFPVTGPVRYTMTAERRRRALRAAGAAGRDSRPLRRLEALPREPRRDRARVRARACCRARSDSLAASRSRGGADRGQWRTVVAFGTDRGALSRARLTPGIAS